MAHTYFRGVLRPPADFVCVCSLQGSAVLGCRLGESEDDAARLRRCFLQLRGEARGKRAAARRDTTVVRMRLQRGDKRVIPHILQQGEPKMTQEEDSLRHRNIK